MCQLAHYYSYSKYSKSACAFELSEVTTAYNPKIIIADEPTGSLDSHRSVEIMKLLQKLNDEEGITVVLVTHEPDMAKYAKRIVHFVDGTVASDQENKPC